MFLDLKKAFDTVNFEILLGKMKNYGFRGVPLEWFKNYLTNRKQFVFINGVKSEEKTLHCGVPQGSVLGPLLFLLYINDLPKATNFFSLLFADDTTFQLCHKDIKFLFERAKEELTKASEWFKLNKLTLNVKKTKFILFRKSNMKLDEANMSLRIDNQIDERVGKGCEETSFKFVGHHLDEFLSWDRHIQLVENKLSKSNFLINSSKNIFPLHIRKQLYNALFKPHLEYGLLAWGGVKATQLKKITNLQKKCVRNVANRQVRSHTDPLFKSLNILKFTDIFETNSVLFMHKFAYGRIPPSINNLFNPLGINSRTGNYKLPIYKQSFFDKFPTAFFPKNWNTQKSESNS